MANDIQRGIEALMYHDEGDPYIEVSCEADSIIFSVHDRALDSRPILTVTVD